MTRTSIVIPTFNRAAYLEQAIASALDQCLPALEVIVVDDGSTDNTREIVERFTSDVRLVYVYQENQGATAAFNRGISESTGDYVGILGSDDWYLPDGLAPLARELDGRPDVGLVAGGYLFVDARNRVLREATPWRDYTRLDVDTWLMWCPVLFQAALIRKSWVDRMGGVATGLQDWDLGLRLAHAGCQMAWIERAVFAYRVHPTQSIRDPRLIRTQSVALLDSFFARSDLPVSVLARKDTAYANAYVKGALTSYEAGQFAEAQQDIETACRLAPALLVNRGQQLFDIIVARSNNPLAANTGGYLNTVFAHLPPAAAVLQGRRREAIAAAAIDTCFRAYQERDWPKVRRTWLQAIVHDPGWLRNRGVLSIGRQALGV
jgi:glycosyltransferase involved in cell wall biosynthesis